MTDAMRYPGRPPRRLPLDRDRSELEQLRQQTAQSVQASQRAVSQSWVLIRQARELLAAVADVGNDGFPPLSPDSDPASGREP